MHRAEDQYERMIKTPIPRLVTSLFIPTVAANLITVIYNTADTYFVSQIDKSATAAVGAVYAVMAVIQATAGGIGMGAGSLISVRLGEKKHSEAESYASSALFAAVALGIVVCGAGLAFLSPLLSLLGCSETMVPYAAPYAKWILIAAPVHCATFVLSNILRSEGAAAFSIVGTAAGGILNVILDPIFIFTLEMGAEGASLATAISQLVSCIIPAVYFAAGRSAVRISWSGISKRAADYRKIISTGLPTVFRQGLGSVSAVALNNAAVVYGDAAVAAITIANKVYTLVRHMIIGIGQGFQPVAGYNFGAGNKKRTWYAFTFSTAVGTLLCTVCALLIAPFAADIMRWFCDDAAVIQIGVKTLYYVAAVMPLMAFSTFVNQLYQCLGFRLPATLLASCRQGIFFLPAVILLPLRLGCTGVQLSQPAADALTFVVSVPFLIRFRKKHLK